MEKQLSIGEALESTLHFINSRAEKHYLGGPEEMLSAHERKRCLGSCCFCKVDADATTYLLTKLS